MKKVRITETNIKRFLHSYEKDAAVLATALFGSRARGDYEENSDTDILLVTSNTKPKHVTEGRYSLSFYSQEHLLDKAKNGDLFVCHLVYEAKSLADQHGFFNCLKQQFHFRDSYIQEIDHACDLGWFLVHYADSFENHKISNKRIAWCVRTILIARSAERKSPIFSASQLSESVSTPTVKNLINNKDDNKLDKASLVEFANFLKCYGSYKADYNNIKSIKKFLIKFRDSNNTVALNTFRALHTEEHMLSYE